MPFAVELHNLSGVAYKKARRKHIKTTKNRLEKTDTNWIPFRTAEKKFEARFPPPDLSNVFDLAVSDPHRNEEIKRGGWNGSADAIEHRPLDLSLGEGTSRKSYIFPSIPALVFILSFVSLEEQRTLIQWSLRDRARHPNEINLDTHYILPHDGLWNSYMRSKTGGVSEDIIQPRASILDLSSEIQQELGPRRLSARF